MYPTSFVALERFQVLQYDNYKRVKNTSFRCNGQCSSLYKQCIFICSCRNEEIFSEIFA